MKTIKLTLIFLISLFLINNVIAVGDCSLNRVDPFTPGEIGTLSCACTTPQEENRVGFIVFFQDNGTILQSTVTTSGSCQLNVFGQSYVFLPDNFFNGTAVFSTNADGTGIPLNWGNIGDVINDTFEVINGSITDCIIGDVIIPESIDLGIDNANVFRVKDSITGEPIAGINCIAHAFSADGSPILIEPYGKDKEFYQTGHDGISALTARFDQDRFDPFTTYTFQLLCQCFNQTDSVCYNDNTGDRLGYKSCETTALFTTGEDKRLDNLMPYWILLTIVVVFTLIGLAFKLQPMVVFAGIMQFIFGLTIFTVRLGTINPKITIGVAIILCMTGLSLILSYVGGLFDKKKRREDLEIEFQQ